MDAVKVFSNALKAEGIDAKVKTSSSASQMHQDFIIEYQVNGKPLVYKSSIPVDGISDKHKKERIALAAEETYRAFQQKTQEQIEWGKKAVQFNIKGEYSVTCLHCRESVSVDDLRSNVSQVAMAESTVPNPSVPDISSISDQKIKFALLALLRENCEPNCANSHLNQNL